jgi:hypothetical protein
VDALCGIHRKEKKVADGVVIIRPIKKTTCTDV